MKTVKIQLKWAAAHPGQLKAPVRSRMGIVLEDGSGVAIDWVTGRTPPHGDGSMYSQANVRVGKCAAAPYPSVKGVAGSGWVREAGRGKTARGWKGVRPWVRLENRTVRAGEEPEEHKGAMARILVVFLRIQPKSRKKRQAKVCDRTGQPVVCRTLAKTSDELLS